MELDKTQLYFITGFFWQEVAALGIGFAPIEGAVAMVQSGVSPFFFAGTFWWQEDRFVGQMKDDHGPSNLYNIKLEVGILSFSKLYEKDRDKTRRSITYTLDYQSDGSWEGKYSLIIGLEGPVLCSLQSMEHQRIRDKGQRFYQKWKAQGRKQ